MSAIADGFEYLKNLSLTQAKRQEMECQVSPCKQSFLCCACNSESCYLRHGIVRGDCSMCTFSGLMYKQYMSQTGYNCGRLATYIRRQTAVCCMASCVSHKPTVESLWGVYSKSTTAVRTTVTVVSM